MSSHSGPNSANDGLVLFYDIANTKKSWRGAPTTNLDPDMTINSMGFGLVFQFIEMEDDWKKYSISGTWTGGTYPYSFSVSSTLFVAGNTYSTRCLLKTNVPQKFETLFTGMNYVNEPMIKGGVGFSDADSNGIITVGRSNFQYTNNVLQPGYLLSRPKTIPFIAATDFIYLKEGQTEVGVRSTPFTIGTRSNMQSIIDLTSNSLIVVNSLTYIDDGSFNFNGSGNSISIPSIDFSNEQTIEIWLLPEENDGVRRNPYNQAYGGYGTWTHEPNGTINYYYGDAGSNTQPYIGHTSNFTVAQNEIACVCTTRNTTQSVWYKNGVRFNSFNHSYSTLTTDLNSIIIGTGYAGSYLGKIFAVKLYNRSLSPNEVQENFQSTRSRYGV